ncbi:MAG TPA: hypothetical protein VEA61_11535 [Allosphingosinicella sp.]|nr:hypothetical protein [Allosphingosinicella sp.]
MPPHARIPREEGRKWSFVQPVKGALRIGFLTGRKASAVLEEMREKGYVLYRSERITRPA